MEEEDYKTRLENFVYDSKKRFVDPCKVEAVDEYGLDTAIKMWQNGKPDSATLDRLRINSCKRAMAFRLKLERARIKTEY